MKIEHVSICERVQLYFLAFTYGWYLVSRRFVGWAWNPYNYFALQQRDKPPPCLVDDSYGKHSYIKIKGTKFHYVEAGEKTKPLLLLLHGFPDFWLSWRKQLPALSEHFRVVALDLKGFGDSDKPLYIGSYGIEILIDELKEFIFALGATKCSIIGHDLGGLLGWYMAAMYDDVVCKFVAISSPHPDLYWNCLLDNTVFSRKWMHFSRLPFLPEIDVLKEDLAVINATFKHIHKKEKESEKDIVEAYKYAFSRKEDWTGPINYFRNLPFTRLSASNNEKIAVRSLLLIGNADPSVSLEGVINSGEFVEYNFVKIVKGAGHFPHQDQPELVNEAIIKFLVVQPSVEKSPSKNSVSSWFSLSTTMKLGNQVLDAAKKRTNGVVSGLPIYLGQSTNT